MNKNTKQVQDRKAKAAPRYADDTNASSDAPKRWSDYTVQFEFPEPTELPPPLIQLNDVSFQYPGRDDFGLKDLNIGVDMGSRVAIVGPNGAGKTTLMNLLSGMSASYPIYIADLQLQCAAGSKDLDSSKSPKGKMPGSEGNHGQTSEHMQ